jgi:hypothetical protein
MLRSGPSLSRKRFTHQLERVRAKAELRRDAESGFERGLSGG